MKNRVIIISGGVISDQEFLRLKIKEAGNPVILCADGAARHLRPINIVPAFIVGDMDSIDEDILEHFAGKGSKTKIFPRDKDKTDTQLALELAFEMNPDEIWIFGALGGRMDHTLANISLLVVCAKQGVETRIIDESCEIFVVDRLREIDGERGETVSLLPLSSKVTGITLTGFEYPVSQGEMVTGNPYGISNRLTGTKGTISVKSGYLLVIRNFGKGENI